MTTEKRSAYLWISNDLLAVNIDRQSVPTEPKHAVLLQDMIQGLARAARAVAYQVQTDDKADPEFLVQPIEDIANAIVLLSQLSAAVSEDIERGEGKDMSVNNHSSRTIVARLLQRVAKQEGIELTEPQAVTLTQEIESGKPGELAMRIASRVGTKPEEFLRTVLAE